MTGRRRRRRRGVPHPQIVKPATTLAKETEIPEHLEPASAGPPAPVPGAPMVAKPGQRVTMNIEAGPGEVGIHLDAPTEHIKLSPVDARQMSKALLKAALASEAKAVERAAKIIGPDATLDLVRQRAERKLEDAAALAEGSEEPS